MEQNNNYPGMRPMHQPPAQPKTNGKAITALVLGILSLVIPYLGFIIGIVAIVFAKLAKDEIKRTGDEGRGLATAGLVTGIIGTALYSIIIILFIIGVVAFMNYDSYYMTLSFLLGK
jgi:Domain of unknown function (DUF4190)